MSSAASRFWAIILALGCGAAGFGLAASDGGPSRWVGAGMLAVLAVVGIGQPVRLLAIPLGVVLAGLYVASVAALGPDVRPSQMAATVGGIGIIVAALVAEMFGRVCTAGDERRVAADRAAQALSPTDDLAGVLKWQHAVALFDRELTRARRLDQSLGFLLVSIRDVDTLDRRLGADGARRVLGAVGGHLLQSCRSTDVVMYRGAGQFGIVLPDTSPELAAMVAERIVERLPDHLPTSLIVGAASFPRDGDAPDGLLGRAAAAVVSEQGRPAPVSDSMASARA